jgi:hypothetical protein
VGHILVPYHGPDVLYTYTLLTPPSLHFFIINSHTILTLLQTPSSPFLFLLLSSSSKNTWEKEQDQAQVMESQDLSPPHVDASRPSLGFPLGTALLLIIIFSLSGIFSCCYHWDKFRSLRQSFSEEPDHEADIEASPSKSKPTCTVSLPLPSKIHCFFFLKWNC